MFTAAAMSPASMCQNQSPAPAISSAAFSKPFFALFLRGRVELHGLGTSKPAPFYPCSNEVFSDEHSMDSVSALNRVCHRGNQ